MNLRYLIWVLMGGLMLASCAHSPEPSDPIPSRQQLEWQQLENYAFIHFGLNTFNNMDLKTMRLYTSA